MTIKARIRKYIPKYAAPWLIAILTFNCAVYFGTRLFTGSAAHHSMLLPLDGQIPFVPAWIVIYFLAYIFWGVNYIMIAREDPMHCRRILTGELIAKFICLLFFVLYPTTFDRPIPEGTDFFSSFTRLIYAMDEPNNLFPSIHCLESYLCWRGLIGCRKVSRGYKTFSLCFAIAVFASTVLVKQHVLVDIPAGIVVGELGLFISSLIFRRKEGTAYE